MNTCTRVVIQKSRSDVFRLWGLGDWHLGARGVDRDRLSETVEFIRKDPKSLVICLGDLVDAITATDKRWDARCIDPKYRIEDVAEIGPTQKEDAKRYLVPIKDKIVAMVSGNHEETLALRTGYDVTKILSNELGIPFLGYSGFARIVFKRHSDVNAFDVYVHHGRGGGRSAGATKSSLNALFGMFDADVYLQGHVHNQDVVMRPVLHMNGAGSIKERYRLAAFSGSFLKTYDSGGISYAEKAQFQPAHLGAICVFIRPTTRQLDASYNAVGMIRNGH